jgi:SNF2 family DNA or RNA helicase
MIYTTIPYQHQKDALTEAWQKPGFAFFLEQGTGKSKIIVDEIVNLIEQDQINCAVIIAPNQVHENWKEQFEIHGPAEYNRWTIQVYKSYGSSPRAKKQEETTRNIIQSGKVLIFLMNIESLSARSGQDYLRRVVQARRHLYLAVDESHKIKTPGAVRTKILLEASKWAKYRRIATGTEAQEGLEDLFSQLKFLDPNITGHRSFTSYRSMFCIIQTYMGYPQIIGYHNQEVLAQRMAPYVYQKRKKDCLDLPDKVYVTHNLELTKEQATIYNELEEELIHQIDDKTIVDTTQALVRVLRLQQVLCGHISAEGKTKFIDSNRAKFVSELVQEASGKSIVFCRFLNDVDLVTNQLSEDKIQSVGITGRVVDRLSQINLWRNDPKIKALVMTIQTGGTGLTLNEASSTIYYSNDWSSTNRLQSEDRNHRIGQVNKVTYHDLITPGRVDERLLKALRAKDKSAMEFRSVVDVKKFLLNGGSDV